MRFAHVWSLRFSSRHLKGWLAAFQASGPPVVPSPTRGLAQLGVVFACAHCYKLCVVGWTRVFALSALPSTPRWSRTPLCRYPAGGGAAGDCQAVALALWSQPLVGPGQEPFCVLTQDFCLVLSVTGSGDPVAGERSLGGGARPASQVLSFILAVAGPAATPSPLLGKPALLTSCPCLLLPRNMYPFQPQGRGRWGKDGHAEGV